ncbi:unnamed protein product, partial [Allacma fusca]
ETDDGTPAVKKRKNQSDETDSGFQNHFDTVALKSLFTPPQCNSSSSKHQKENIKAVEEIVEVHKDSDEDDNHNQSSSDSENCETKSDDELVELNAVYLNSSNVGNECIGDSTGSVDISISQPPEVPIPVAVSRQGENCLEPFLQEFRRFQKEIFGEVHSIKSDIEIIRSQLSKNHKKSSFCPVK